eukprot:c20862_g2_i1.p1 GENE.c20862_g2_i1~~c20862_g2_i1.p1  ORF type:complete len:678 (-),score=309.21 c20862_g2_i1:38-2071(-)
MFSLLRVGQLVGGRIGIESKISSQISPFTFQLINQVRYASEKSKKTKLKKKPLKKLKAKFISSAIDRIKINEPIISEPFSQTSTSISEEDQSLLSEEEKRIMEVERLQDLRQKMLQEILSVTKCRIGTVVLPSELKKAITRALSSTRGKELKVMSRGLQDQLRATHGSLTKESRHALSNALEEEENRQLDDQYRESIKQIRRSRKQLSKQLSPMVQAQKQISSSGKKEEEKLQQQQNQSSSLVFQAEEELPKKEVSLKTLAQNNPVYLSSLAVDIAREKGLKPISYKEDEALAYLALRLPSTYSVLFRIFKEIKNRAPWFTPTRFLDFGSGPGTGAWAAKNTWLNADSEISTSKKKAEELKKKKTKKFLRKKNSSSTGSTSTDVTKSTKEMKLKEKTPLEKITNVEFSLSMSEMGKELLKGNSIEKNCEWLRTLPMSSLFIKPSDIVTMDNGDKSFSEKLGYDLVLASYVFNELQTLEDRIEMASLLWERVRDSGLLVIVEPGTPFGFSNIKAVRQAILDMNKENCSVFAPCPHSEACPKKSDSWCHFVQRVQRPPEQMMAKDGVTKGYEDEKFSYIVFAKTKQLKGPVLNPTLPNSETDLINRETFRENSAQWSRHIAEPARKGGHAHLSLCTTEGIVKGTVAKSQQKYGLSYKLAKKSAWGDLFPYILKSKQKID